MRDCEADVTPSQRDCGWPEPNESSSELISSGGKVVTLAEFMKLPSDSEKIEAAIRRAQESIDRPYFPKGNI